MRERLTIVKLGNKVVEDKTALKRFITDFSAIEGRKMLIHGGALSKMVADKMGISVKVVDGNSVVDIRMLDVLTMVNGGLVNRKFVSLLQWHKVNAAGLTGADMNLVTCARRDSKGKDMTGTIKIVNVKALADIIESEVTPVLASLGHDGRGNLLALNADDLASEVARAMSLRYDVTLIYCFERKGVLMNLRDPDSVIASLRRTQFKSMREMDMIDEEIVPKLENAFSATAHGVKEVVITDAAHVTDKKSGTHIRD